MGSPLKRIARTEIGIKFFLRLLEKEKFSKRIIEKCAKLVTVGKGAFSPSEIIEKAFSEMREDALQEAQKWKVSLEGL